MTPSLTVIIPTHGHFDYAARAITSLFEHTVSAVAVAVTC